MNNTFEIQRFLFLIRRQWISNKKEYLLIVGSIVSILLFYYGIQIYSILDFFENSKPYVEYINFSSRIGLFCIVGILYITLTSSLYFRKFGKHGTAIPELMLPASQLEKFLTSFFYTIVIGFSVYFIIFYLIDFGFIAIFKNHLIEEFPELDSARLDEKMEYFFPYINNESIKYMIFIPFLLNAIFLLGSLYFTKNQYIKTLVSIAVYIFIAIIIIGFISKILFSGSIQLERNSLISNFEMPKLLCFGGWVLCFALWIITFIRLKEKEV